MKKEVEKVTTNKKFVLEENQDKTIKEKNKEVKKEEKEKKEKILEINNNFSLEELKELKLDERILNFIQKDNIYFVSLYKVLKIKKEVKNEILNEEINKSTRSNKLLKTKVYQLIYKEKNEFNVKYNILVQLLDLALVTKTELLNLIVNIESEIEKEILKNESKYITILDYEYPDKLREIYDPPYIIYYEGDISLIKEKMIVAVVGSRDASNKNAIIARKITERLVKKGYIIVSGMACGIDGVAHKSAIDQKVASTIAVLGTGLSTDVIYPKINIELKKEILKSGGTVISEYKYKASGNRYTFPMRNRIIAGLADSIIVLQANIKSGSIITCNLGLEQGKNVYAVVGEFAETSQSGINLLLRDGATPLTSFDDIDYYF